MYNLIVMELKKLLKNKKLYIPITLVQILTILSLISNPSGSAFYIPVAIMSTLCNTYLMVILLSFSCYAYGVELDSSTLKIIKTKPVSSIEVLSAKFISSMLYNFFCIFSIFIIATLIAVLVYPVKDIDFVYLKMHIPKNNAFFFTLALYISQFITSMFITVVSYFYTIFFKKTTISVLATTITFMLLDLTKVVGRLGISSLYLPTNANNILKEMVGGDVDSNLFIKLGVILLYTILVFMIVLIKYRRMEVK